MTTNPACARLPKVLETQTIERIVDDGNMAADRHKWLDEHIEMLGTMPDAEVAKRLGIPESRVKNQRSALRIKMGRGGKAKTPANPRGGKPPINWTKGMIAVLGKASDSEIAERLGISISTVIKKRHALDIEPYNRHMTYQYGKLEWPDMGKEEEHEDTDEPMEDEDDLDDDDEQYDEQPEEQPQPAPAPEDVKDNYVVTTKQV